MEEEEQDDFADVYNATPSPAGRQAPVLERTSIKRKHDAEDDDSDVEDADDFYIDKRQKTVSPTNAGGPQAPQVPALPVELWQYVFQFVDPKTLTRLLQDSSLMFSDYSALLAIAPFAFMTGTNHIVSSTWLRSGNGRPASVEVSKIFFIPMLERLQADLQDAQRQAPSAASELYNKARAQRQEKLESAEVWAQWHAVGGLSSKNGDLSVTSATSATSSSRAPIATPTRSAQGHALFEDRSSSPPYSPHLSEASSPKKTKTEGESSRPTSSSHTSTSGFPRKPFTGRNANSVKEAKALRRAEIERRCSELVPPIDSILLNHMESFQAAMQIGAPLNDNGWNMLKPRLHAQVAVAREREEERQAALEALRAEANVVNVEDLDSESLKERWDVLQKPVRTRLSGYVDEIVRTSWADGTAINYETSPRFASDALIYVRNRYASDVPKATATDNNNSKLVLENMKWVFDTKIKPLTDPARRDLFLCAGCGDKSKYYAFDSIIQHYAAKHTSSYSSGTVVVAWHEALWPEQPPFQSFPDPDSRRRTQQTPFAHHSAASSQPPAAHNGPHHIYAPVPGFHGGNMMSPQPYGQSRGPFISPGNSQSSPSNHFSGGFGQQPYHASVSPAYQQQSGFMPPGPSGQYNATSPFDPRGFFAGPSPQTPASAPGGWGAPPLSSHPPTYAPSPAQGAPTFLQMQSDAVANIAREVWDALFIVKPIHPSVRIYVLIHHVVSQFKTRFSNEPNLDLFTQCLINHQLMRPMKDANGLACKTCVVNNESHEESHTHAFPLSSGERKLYPFHSLLLHFKNVHVEHALAMENAQTHETAENLHRLDWKEDMIELPEEHIIAGYQNAPGMDKTKFDVLRKAFPSLPEFVERDPAMPIPILGARNTGGPYSAGSGYGYQPMDISPTTDEPFIKLEPGTEWMASAGQGYSPSRPDNVSVHHDNEYDPTRPAFNVSRPSHVRQDYGQNGRSSYHQAPHARNGGYRTDHSTTPTRQSFNQRPPSAYKDINSSNTATNPQLSALLENLTAHQAVQAQAKAKSANSVTSGSQQAKDQADSFLRDFIPLSTSRESTSPTGMMPPPPAPPPSATYRGGAVGYEPMMGEDPYSGHSQQSRRASSTGGGLGYDERPIYVGLDQQRGYGGQYAAWYPHEENVEYVYVRRRDAEYQQGFQGYR